MRRQIAAIVSKIGKAAKLTIIKNLLNSITLSEGINGRVEID